jgi:hypothetical protein
MGASNGSILRKFRNQRINGGRISNIQSRDTISRWTISRVLFLQLPYASSECTIVVSVCTPPR